MSDIYKSIIAPSSEVLFKEKNSKFFGYAFPIISDAEVLSLLKQLRKVHQGAGHFCYAYQLGVENRVFRANDDGEPSNSAGMPIYGQIQSHDLTNVLIVVVRYFGGVKLGVGGLVSAYKHTAQLALENATIEERFVMVQYRIGFSYANMGKIMRVIKEKNISIISQELEILCEIHIAVRKQDAVLIENIFGGIVGVAVKPLNT